MNCAKKDLKIAKEIFEASLVGENLNETKLLELVAKVKKFSSTSARKILLVILKLVSDFYKSKTLLVESAQVLPPHYLDQIKTIFEKRVGKRLNLTFRKNEALLAGIKVTIGDNVWDYSIRTDLDYLKEPTHG